jgi:hypothetical protein
MRSIQRRSSETLDEKTVMTRRNDVFVGQSTVSRFLHMRKQLDDIQLQMCFAQTHDMINGVAVGGWKVSGSNNGIPPKLKCLSPQNPCLPVQLQSTAFQILLVH